MSISFFDFKRPKATLVKDEASEAPPTITIQKRKEPFEEYKPSFKYFNWMDDAKVFNKRSEKINPTWIQNNADVIVLYFSLHEVDKDGIMKKFYRMYEDVKHDNFPIEVINVPQDADMVDMVESYEKQANWFTLKTGDSLIPTLTYLYGITSAPHLLVLGDDGNIISQHGISDLEEYGKNALMCWLPHSGSLVKPRKLKLERNYYDYDWPYHSKASDFELKIKSKRKYFCRFKEN